MIMKSEFPLLLENVYGALYLQSQIFSQDLILHIKINKYIHVSSLQI